MNDNVTNTFNVNMTVFLTNDDNNDELKSDGFLGISPCPDDEF